MGPHSCLFEAWVKSVCLTLGVPILLCSAWEGEGEGGHSGCPFEETRVPGMPGSTLRALLYRCDGDTTQFASKFPLSLFGGCLPQDGLCPLLHNPALCTPACFGKGYLPYTFRDQETSCSNRPSLLSTPAVPGPWRCPLRATLGVLPGSSTWCRLPDSEIL